MNRNNDTMPMRMTSIRATLEIKEAVLARASVRLGHLTDTLLKLSGMHTRILCSGCLFILPGHINKISQQTISRCLRARIALDEAEAR
jgi:hypothetical protein